MTFDAGQSADLDLSVTLAPLLNDSTGDSVKAALERIAGLGLRHVQVAATMPGLRPRDLDRSARRDLLANFRRRELSLSGLDAWVPTTHFSDPAQSDRAAQAVCEIIDLASNLGRVPVSLVLPADDAIIRLILDRAHRAGVAVADHAVPPSLVEGVETGVDPAAWLSQNKDPVAAVHACANRVMSARLVDLLVTGMRGPPGNGTENRLNVTEYKIALAVNGYRRPVVIDARQWNDPWNGVEESARVWRGA